jgi:hypothetical protein
MIYRIYKATGQIGTSMEKINLPMTERHNISAAAANQTLLADFDNETNTICIYDDEVIDLSSIVQKFINHSNLPDKHQFKITHKELAE